MMLCMLTAVSDEREGSDVAGVPRRKEDIKGTISAEMRSKNPVACVILRRRRISSFGFARFARGRADRGMQESLPGVNGPGGSGRAS